MAIVGGESCSSAYDVMKDKNTNQYTFLNTTNKISGNGVITTCCVRVNNNTYSASGLSVSAQLNDILGVYYDGNMQVGLYRDDGTNYVYVSHVATIGVTGDTWIDGVGGTGNCPVLLGDINYNTTKVSWGTSDYLPVCHIDGNSILSDVYVNSSTGNDSNAGDSCVAGHPVQTFQKAYDLLNSGGTIHVCNSGADFSGETVTLNKSFSITVDGDGNFYMPQAS